MKYLNQKFSVTVGGSDYAEGWERVFGSANISRPNVNCSGALPSNPFWNVASPYIGPVDTSLKLPEVQKSLKEWSNHNFPVKVTKEHDDLAHKFLERTGLNCYPEDLKSLSFLLAERDHRSHRPLIGAAEELGELCHAHLKNEQGIRGTPEEWVAAKKDAIGDILIYLLDYANKEGLCLEECLSVALDEIHSRDWAKFPHDGKTS